MTFPVYSMTAEEQEAYLDLAYQDVSDAFTYYMSEVNDGRPLILAGFSQGSQMLLRLLEDYFDEASYQDLLVAAYCIGWPVTEEDLNQYPTCRWPRERTTPVSSSPSTPRRRGSPNPWWCPRHQALAINP